MAKKSEAKQGSLAVDIGIAEADRRAIADGLNALLADNYALYLKTHAFHWNVTGPMFQTLHLMFETHYNELWLANDLIAERIRALGFPVRATYAAFTKLSSIPETEGVPEATDMVRELTKGRRESARARLREKPDLAVWLAVIDAVCASDFCKGSGKDGWKAGFDWLVRPDTATKALEGAYDNRTSTKRAPGFLSAEDNNRLKAMKEETRDGL